MYGYFYRKLILFVLLLLFFFFRTAMYNRDHLHENKIKTIFLSGSSRDDVLAIIDETLNSPDREYMQADGAGVLVKGFRNEVGELVTFDVEGNLKRRLLHTLKIIYTVNMNGYFQIRTAFPLLRRT